MAEGDDERDHLSAGPWATTTTTTTTSSDRQARPPLSSSSMAGEDAGVARALSFIEPGQRHHGDYTRSSLHEQQRPGRPPGLLDPAARTRSLYVPAPSPSRSRSHASSLRSSHAARPTSSLLDSLPRPKPMRSASSVGAPTVAAMVDDDDEERMQTWRATAHGDTPLDRTIDAIGMGKYQWALLVLTGCGWAADNMWLQGVAIVLPRVQSTFAISDTSIGLVSSSTFAGMMLGALAWGAYSDTYGRRGAFNGTLSLVAGFGTLAAFAPSFGILCILLFGLGLGLGGSMPTDGTVFLENLPVRKQYLLTALSVFFSAGSVASALIALIVLSPTSGSPTSSSTWRIFLGLLALVTAFFVVLRLVFFPLLESPRFLVSTGKREEARVALQKIADYNSAPLPVALSDVSDRRSGMLGGQGGGRRDGEDGDGDDEEDDEQSGAAGGMRRAGGYTSLPNSATSTDSAATVRPRSTRSTSAAASPPSTSTWTDTLATLREKYDTLLNDSWRRTTLLVWAIWITVNLAFTMFNVFLPKLLAERSGSATRSVLVAEQAEEGDSSSSSALLSYLLYSLLSLPGPLLSSYLIQLPPPLFGRRGTLTLSLLSTSGCVFLFFSRIATSSPTLTTLSTMAVSLAASTAYAALYGYTPEVFSEASLRGTAAGTASALGRLAGIVAPLVAGRLLAAAATGATRTRTTIETEGGGEVVVGVQGGGGGHSMLGWTCTVLFLVAAGCAAALPIETWTDPRAAGQEEDDDEGQEGEDPPRS